MRSPPLQSSLAFSLTSEQLLKPVVVMSSFLYQLEAGSPSAIGSCLNCSTDKREGQYIDSIVRGLETSLINTN